MRKLFQNFRKSESGATLVEYGVALILAIVVGGGALVTLAGGVENNMEVGGCGALDIGVQDGVAATDTGCP